MQPMTWEEAARLADQIADSADGGNWHARVEVVYPGDGYATSVRPHNTATWYHVSSMAEFRALWTQLSQRG